MEYTVTFTQTTVLFETTRYDFNTCDFVSTYTWNL